MALRRCVFRCVLPKEFFPLKMHSRQTAAKLNANANHKCEYARGSVSQLRVRIRAMCAFSSFRRFCTTDTVSNVTMARCRYELLMETKRHVHTVQAQWLWPATLTTRMCKPSQLRENYHRSLRWQRLKSVDSWHYKKICFGMIMWAFIVYFIIFCYFWPPLCQLIWYS